MAREAADRYRTMGELAEDLRAYLDNRVVRAHANGAWAEARKWVRRNRALAVVGGALAATLVAATVVTVSLWRDAHREAELAREAREDAVRNLVIHNHDSIWKALLPLALRLQAVVVIRRTWPTDFATVLEGSCRRMLQSCKAVTKQEYVSFPQRYPFRGEGDCRRYRPDAMSVVAHAVRYYWSTLLSEVREPAVHCFFQGARCIEPIAGA